MLASPSSRSTARTRLREATRRAHDAVDAGFSGFDLSAPSDYAVFLARQAAAHVPVERALDAAGAETVVADWPERRRAHLLQADMADLGAVAAPPVPAPVFDSRAALLGGLYVLEGSRLGGAVLQRRVADGAPKRFLASCAPHGSWARLLALLEAELQCDAALDAAIIAARAVFDCFGQAAIIGRESPVGGQ